MAELLIRVIDKVNASDPVANAHCLKRGEVVVICPDGHPWSIRERTAPHWRIVQIPGVQPGDLSHLVEQENAVELQIPYEDALRRTYMLDFDLEPDPDKKSEFDEANRKSEKFEMTELQLRNVEQKKPIPNRGVAVL